MSEPQPQQCSPSFADLMEEAGRRQDIPSSSGGGRLQRYFREHPDYRRFLLESPAPLDVRATVLRDTAGCPFTRAQLRAYFYRERQAAEPETGVLAAPPQTPPRPMLPEQHVGTWVTLAHLEGEGDRTYPTVLPVSQS